MNVRVIAGKYGGRILAAPGRRTTHAMSERVRNALFNSLGTSIQDAKVLDAFAGSGCVGFEAISRGAHDVTFVERDRVASRIIQENIATLSAGDEAKLVNAPVASWIKTYDGELFDLIIADPPYNNMQLSTVSSLFSLLKPNAVMILSSPGRGEVPIQNNEIVVVDNRSYGSLCLTYFRRSDSHIK